MHKFLPSLIDVDGTRYNSPVTVAIGPYDHGGHPRVLEAERLKHVAATQCMRESSCSAQEMYNAVSSVSDVARRLYHHDDVAEFGHHDDFVPLMFLDACFLVQFMVGIKSTTTTWTRCYSYFYANFERISTDVMMLENQIPWVVVETIFSFMPPAPSPWLWEKLLVAAWLVNTAAFGLCKTPNFEAAGVQDEDSAVCSYLHLFAMLLDQKKHVRELQENHVIEGGGLTSEEALQFFTCIGKNMCLGMFYLDIIIKIENFKHNRSFLLRSYLFIMKNMNKIIAVISIIGAVVGILSSLQALKPAT